MRTSEGLKYAKELLGKRLDVELLALEIVDILRDRDENNHQITERERFILGLRYAEFLDDDSTVAFRKQEKYLYELSINKENLLNAETKIWNDIRLNNYHIY